MLVVCLVVSCRLFVGRLLCVTVVSGLCICCILVNSVAYCFV